MVPWLSNASRYVTHLGWYSHIVRAMSVASLLVQSCVSSSVCTQLSSARRSPSSSTSQQQSREERSGAEAGTRRSISSGTTLCASPLNAAPSGRNPPHLSSRQASIYFIPIYALNHENELCEGWEQVDGGEELFTSSGASLLSL